MTFDDTGTSTRVVSAAAECPEKGDVSGVDEAYEVLSDCYLLDMADSRISRFIDCWSSYCNLSYKLINNHLDHLPAVLSSFLSSLR